MLLINCEISLMLNWSKKNFLVVDIGKFRMIDIKFHVPVVTLSIQYNEKLLKQLESGYKRTINWNKYQSKITEQTPNRYLDFSGSK